MAEIGVTMGLGPLIRGFLEADGFSVEQPAAHCIAAERRPEYGKPERCYVWFRDPEAGIEPEQSALIADFEMAKDVLGDGASAFFVTPSTAGLTAEFRQKASAAGIGVRVPVQFFDTAYKWESGQAIGAGRSRPAGERLLRAEREGAEIAALRVPQPFDALSALGSHSGGFGGGEDLLEHLAQELSSPAEGPRLTVVLGHAGAGKTFLVTSLYALLHRRFLEAKQAQRMAARPVLFQPDMIRLELDRNFEGLLRAVAQTEVVAGATPPPLMRFLNRAGFTCWFFDGLDEFFAGETDFVAEIEACLAPGSRSRIVLCTRDSLLTTSSALRALVDRHLGQGTVRLYELAGWQRPSQRALAFVRLAGRLPGPGETADPEPVARFLARLDGSEAARRLATLPFYCDLLIGLEGEESGRLDEPFELLSLAVDRLIDREAAKLASGDLGFGWDVFAGAENFVAAAEIVDKVGAGRFADAGERERLFAALSGLGRERLVELVETIAHATRMSTPYPNEGRSLTTEEIEDLANFYLDVGLETELEPRVLLALVQFALFAPGEKEGEVRFAHEIIADFLAARHAMRILRMQAQAGSAVAQALGVRRDLEGGVVVGYIVHELARDPELASLVRAQVEAGEVPERSAEAARQLLAAMDGARL